MAAPPCKRFVIGQRKGGRTIPVARQVAREVARGLYPKMMETEVERYAERVVVAIPLGRHGGAVALQDEYEPRHAWIDAYAVGAHSLPNIRTTRAAVWLLKQAGFHYLLTETEREPKMRRYWRRFGLQEHENDNGTFTLCLK